MTGMLIDPSNPLYPATVRIRAADSSHWAWDRDREGPRLARHQRAETLSTLNRVLRSPWSRPTGTPLQLSMVFERCDGRGPRRLLSAVGSPDRGKAARPRARTTRRGARTRPHRGDTGWAAANLPGGTGPTSCGWTPWRTRRTVARRARARHLQARAPWPTPRSLTKCGSRDRQAQADGVDCHPAFVRAVAPTPADHTPQQKMCVPGSERTCTWIRGRSGAACLPGRESSISPQWRGASAKWRCAIAWNRTSLVARVQRLQRGLPASAPSRIAGP